MIFAEGSEFIRYKELVVYFAFHERGNVRQFGLDLAVLDSNLRLALEAREGIWVVKHLGADIRKQPLPSRRAAVTTGEARADEEKRIRPASSTALWIIDLILSSIIFPPVPIDMLVKCYPTNFGECGLKASLPFCPSTNPHARLSGTTAAFSTSTLST